MQTKSKQNLSSRPSYAGIGSRKTPGKILKIMEKIGHAFAQSGWILRTGNCTGADQAFQAGANSAEPGLVELYLPWPGYEAESVRPGNAVYTPGYQAYAIAAKHHPAWGRCSRVARSMHARNVEILLGPDLAEPVNFLVCWTPGGGVTGGTAQGIQVARSHGVPVYNLALPDGLAWAEARLGQSCQQEKQPEPDLPGLGTGQLYFAF